MPAVLIGFGLVAAVFVFFLLKGMSKDGASPVSEATLPESSAPLPTIDPDELRKLLITDPSSVVVADIRNDEAFVTAHVTGSVFVSNLSRLSEIEVPENGMLAIIPAEDRERNRLALETLSETGNRYGLVKDGLAGWQAVGGTIVTKPDPFSAIDNSKVDFVTPENLRRKFSDGTIPYEILDIRAEEDVTPMNGTILRIPYAELETRRDEIPSATNIVLCAASEDDAFRGAVTLFDLGFFSVDTLRGSCENIAK
jgi:rhodanese-related sulfurtransferase